MSEEMPPFVENPPQSAYEEEWSPPTSDEASSGGDTFTLSAHDTKVLAEFEELLSTIDVKTWDKEVLKGLADDIKQFNEYYENDDWEGLYRLGRFDEPESESDDSDSEVPINFGSSKLVSAISDFPAKGVAVYQEAPSPQQPPGVLDSSALFSRRPPEENKPHPPDNTRPHLTMSQISCYLLRDPRIKKKADAVMRFTFPDGSTLLDACLGNSKYSNPELVAASSAIAAPSASTTDGLKLSDYLIKIMEECESESLSPQSKPPTSRDISETSHDISQEIKESPDSPTESTLAMKENIAPPTQNPIMRSKITPVDKMGLAECDSPKAPLEPLQDNNDGQLVEPKVLQDSPHSPAQLVPHLETASDIISFVSEKLSSTKKSQDGPQSIGTRELTDIYSPHTGDSPASPDSVVTSHLQDKPTDNNKAEGPIVNSTECISDNHITSTSEIKSSVCEETDGLVNSTQDSPTGSMNLIDSDSEQEVDSLEGIIQDGRLLPEGCDTQSFLNKLSVKQLSNLKKLLVSNLKPTNETDHVVSKGNVAVELMRLQSSDSEAIASSSSVKEAGLKTISQPPTGKTSVEGEEKDLKSPIKKVASTTLEHKSKDQSNSGSPNKESGPGGEDMILATTSSGSENSDDEHSLVSRLKRTMREAAKVSVQNKRNGTKFKRSSKSPTQKDDLVPNRRNSGSPHSSETYIKKRDRSFDHRKDKNYQTSPRRSRSPHYRHKYGHLSRKSSPIRRKDSPKGRRSSPFARNGSPQQKKGSPVGRKDSPVRRKSSPVGRRNSPQRKRTTPIGRKSSRSPPGRKRSPPGRRRWRSRSPRRTGGRCRSNSPSKKWSSVTRNPSPFTFKTLADIRPPNAKWQEPPRPPPFLNIHPQAQQPFNKIHPQPFPPSSQMTYYQGFPVGYHHHQQPQAYQPPQPPPPQLPPPQPPAQWPWDTSPRFIDPQPPQYPYNHHPWQQF